LQFEPYEQFQQREKKLEQIQALGYEAFPREFRWTDTPDGLVKKFGARGAAELETEKPETRVAGRMVSYRLMGKAGFAHIQGSGERVQIYVRKDVVGEKGFQLFHLLDLGDHVGVQGRIFRTKTGELSVWVEELFFLSKALLPLPEKWHGLTDVELRYRQRYLDLIASEKSRHVFQTRARIIRELRQFFESRGYMEVETPMMHPIAGGATARPFVTHHNTLNTDLYLRIAPELYLKRLTVGGFDRVYEINRNFRNEGISTQHNPEFTMLEFYEAYSNYRDLMVMNEELFALLAKNITGSTTVKYGDVELDFSKLERLTMREAVIRYWPHLLRSRPQPETFHSRPQLLALMESASLELSQREKMPDPVVAGNEGMLRKLRILRGTINEYLHNPKYQSEPAGAITGALFEAVAEEDLQQPTILYDFPLEISPLSKQKPEDPSLVERFEVYVAGMEIANGFSELNDPGEQERRFLAQMAQGGDEVPKQLDVDYVRALCHGMPPTAGEGIGIDRLTMVLTDSHSIRDVILFPQLRPEGKQEEIGPESTQA
jgi:lysyl-tRNA synthetase, class II